MFEDKTSENEGVRCPVCGSTVFRVVTTEQVAGEPAPRLSGLVVECRSCLQKCRVQWRGELLLRPSSPSAPSRTWEQLETGDVLRLRERNGMLSPGLYAVAELGERVTLLRVGHNEDGRLCTTFRRAVVARSELERFALTGIHLDWL